MAIFVFRKRAFLNPRSSLETSYVQAVVESSHDGEHAWGTYMLTIADCRKSINLDFSIGNPRLRKVAVFKINLLIKILTAFRASLLKEMALIEKGK
jgi:hypothetical protein